MGIEPITSRFYSHTLRLRATTGLNVLVIYLIMICLQGSMENIPAGYEPVSLIEALNGPPPPRTRPPVAPAIASPDTDTASQVNCLTIDFILDINFDLYFC